MIGAPDVLVIGGGAIGVSATLELAKAGASVTLVERGGELGWGCSAGNAGLVCPSHSAPLATPAALRQGLRWLGKPDSPLALRPRPGLLPWLSRFAVACTPERVRRSSRVMRALASASLELHEDLAREGLDTGFARRGLLNVYAARGSFEAARREAETNRAEGLACEIYEDLDGARALVPSLAGPIGGAIHYPGDAHCEPLGFVNAVGRAASEAGAIVRTRVEALGLHRRGGRVDRIVTTAGHLAAGEVVLATGAWAPLLARDLDVVLPVEAGKGYHVDLERGPRDPALPIWFHETRVIATPLAARLRLAGTLELSGLDLTVDVRRVAAVLDAAHRGLGCLRDRRTLEIWSGLRPCSPDGLPIIGRPSSLENVVLATGHGMMGLTLAPVTGRLVRELITGASPSHELGPLSPDRFTRLLGRTG